MVLRQNEIIQSLEKKEIEVEQTPITYIAAIAAGFPIQTSSDWS